MSFEFALVAYIATVTRNLDPVDVIPTVEAVDPRIQLLVVRTITVFLIATRARTPSPASPQDFAKQPFTTHNDGLADVEFEGRRWWSVVAVVWGVDFLPHSTEGGICTHTPLRAPASETGASTRFRHFGLFQELSLIILYLSSVQPNWCPGVEIPCSLRR